MAELPPRFTRYSAEQGLSQAAVRAVCQDETGFLWIGTEDGLNRFDGYGFTVFRNEPHDAESLPDNLINALAPGKGGHLWVGTADRGLARLDAKTLRFERFASDPKRPDSLPPGPVLAVREDKKGRLWVSVLQRGLVRLDPGSTSFQAVSYRQGDAGRPAPPVLSIAEDASGALWLATAGEGVVRLDPETGAIRRWRHDPAAARSLVDDRVLSLLVDRAGNVWAGTVGGISRIDASKSEGSEGVTSWRREGDAGSAGNPSAFPSQVARSLTQDSQGRIWIGTEAGLVRFDPAPGRFSTLRNVPDDPGSLPSDRILVVLADRAGLLWAGLDAAGLAVTDLSPTAFRTYRRDAARPDGLTGRIVRGVHEGPGGKVWVSFAGGGLDLLDPSTGKVRSWRGDPAHPEGLSSDDVYAVLEDPSGAAWIGTLGGGLDRLDPTTGRFDHWRASGAPTGLPSDFLRVLLRDAHGDLWIGTGLSGLARYSEKTGTFVQFHSDPNDPASLSSEVVRALHEGPTGTIWVGTELGVNRLEQDGRSFQRFLADPTKPDTAGISRVYGIHEDASGIVWVGTPRGLARLDPRDGSVRRFRARDGLPNETVYSILPDGRGNLWVSTNRGISRVTPGPEGTSATFRNFDALDGLQSDEFNAAAHFRGPTGTLWFGGIAGLTGFDPAEIRDDPFVPPVSILAFQKLGRVLPRAEGIAAGMVTLHHDEGFFSVEFAALAFRAAAKNRYAWKLEGLDQDWVDGGTRRWAYYTSVPPGDYVFRVKAANKDGIWNETGASLRIVVLPPWWRTRPALALWSLFAVAGLFAVDRSQRRRIVAEERKRSRLVEAELRAQAAEAQAKAVQSESERQSHELEEARALQLSLLPRELPRVPGVSLAALVRTASEVGGDTYDFVLGPGGALSVVVGDATGHGLKAGTVVSVVKGLFRGNPFPEDLPAFLDQCGRVLSDLRLPRLHMALALMVLRGRHVTFCSAGMPPAWVFRAGSGEVEEILLPSAPLGALLGAARSERTFVLDAGDVVLLSSDGLAESPGAGGEPLGYERARELFRKSAVLPPEEAAEAISRAEEAWRAGAARTDDLTLVVLRKERDEKAPRR